jgi:hypothetical protein
MLQTVHTQLQAPPPVEISEIVVTPSVKLFAHFGS